MSRVSRKSFRIGLLVVAAGVLGAVFLAQHGERSYRFHAVTANCQNPLAWGYASIGDEFGRVHSWARVQVNGLEPRQTYEIIGFKNGTARLYVLGHFTTDFSGSGQWAARGLPLGTIDVVNVRIPGHHGSAQLTSAESRAGAASAT